MIEKTSSKFVYDYKIGDLTLFFFRSLLVMTVLGVSVVLFRMLKYVLYDPIYDGTQSPAPLQLAVVFFSTLLVLGFFVVIVSWIMSYAVASKKVILDEIKVQLPLTKGHSDIDYLYFGDILSMEIDKDYREHGPALMVSTGSKRVAYQSIYFQSKTEFEDFCLRLEKAVATPMTA